MELKHYIAFLIMAAVYGAVWWFKSGRWGGSAGYYKNKLGVKEGEQIVAMWSGILREHFSVNPTGVLFVLTNTSRLLLDVDDISVPPSTFHIGQVGVRLHSETGIYGTHMGIHGIERTVVMLLTPVEGDPILVEVARSVFEAVEAWARGAPRETHLAER